MKMTLLLVFAFLSATITSHAQSRKPIKPVLELKMPKTVDDDMPGTRGAGVVWHPLQKKYYASFAGNMRFPMAVFNKSGTLLSAEDLTTMADTRGLWYDPVTKKISGNAYANFGWFTYKLDKDGIPEETETLFAGMFQPGDQSVGAYNIARKQVMFLHEGIVYMYDANGTKQDSLIIHWGKQKETDDRDMDPQIDYNFVSIVYTGIKSQELGFLNIEDKQIELYDINTGFLTKALLLPQDATVESTFNFSYANDIYWLFNIEERKWVGYK